jgi:hypothetical protein
MNVWRGLNEDISKKLKKDDEFIWRNMTSWSSSDNVIKDFLELNSTMCLIEVMNGKDISNYGSSQNRMESILCTGTRRCSQDNTITIVQQPKTFFDASFDRADNCDITGYHGRKIIDYF